MQSAKRRERLFACNCRNPRLGRLGGAQRLEIDRDRVLHNLFGIQIPPLQILCWAILTLLPHEGEEIERELER